MSEWEPATLGDLFELDNTKLGPHDIEPVVMSLSKYDGFVRAEDYFDKRIASEQLDGYKVVEPGEWAFSTIHIDEGSIARNNLVEPGVISPMYTTMRWKAGACRPEYGELLVRQPGMLAEYGRRAQGTVNRRRSLPFKAFAEIEITLPPLAEQRRIVDVMAAVDAQIEALGEQVERGRAALGPLVEALLAEDSDWPVAPLGKVGEFVRGKRFTKADYTESGLGAIHYSHIHTHLGPVTTEVVAHVPKSARQRLRLASTGDVVIAATSEDLAGVGKATVWLGSEDVAVHDDAQIYRHQLDPRFASFLFLSPTFQSQKVQFAGGTKVTRISGADLAKIRVTLPPEDVQARIGEALAAVSEEADRVAAELAALRAFRSALLTSLLNQEIEIPESYDALLEKLA